MYLEEVAKKIADETKKAAERMKNIHVTASVSYYQKNKTWLNKDVSLYPLFILYGVKILQAVSIVTNQKVSCITSYAFQQIMNVWKNYKR